jgi:hypothetical protein
MTVVNQQVKDHDPPYWDILLAALQNDLFSSVGGKYCKGDQIKDLLRRPIRINRMTLYLQLNMDGFLIGTPSPIRLPSLSPSF